MAYGTILGQTPTASNVSYNNASTSSIITGTNVQQAIDQLFQSVSNGKSLIASAITDKGVSTSASDSFATMAENIGKISTGDINLSIFANNGGQNAFQMGTTGSISKYKLLIIYSFSEYMINILFYRLDSRRFALVDASYSISSSNYGSSFQVRTQNQDYFNFGPRDSSITLDWTTGQYTISYAPGGTGIDTNFIRAYTLANV